VCSDSVRKPCASPYWNYLPYLWNLYSSLIYGSSPVWFLFIINASNYRGISKLSAFPTLFENDITPHLEQLYHHISAVLWSTTTNLFELTSFVIQGFKNNLRTDVIYTDFSKAFYSVNHYLLVRKLDLLSFPVDLLNWILNYLNSRKQQVLFKNFLSCILRVTSGVPQWSHIGPLPFTLFITTSPSNKTFACTYVRCRC